MFCCVERDGDGGESILVDGFAVAEKLRDKSPELFETLTTVLVPAHYIEPGVELRASHPTIRLDRSGRVRQLSFNNYDRSPFRLASAEMAKFYEAYTELNRLINDASNQLLIRLDAGDVLLFDNWRALHGRAAYTGKRLFVGCYHNHEDFESRRRVLS
jgi:alpha-ketoglutarate-dependent taurine dioxygenase